MFLRYLWQREKNLSACFFRYDESLLFAPSWDSLLVPSRVSKSISRAKLSSFTQRFLNQLQSPTAPLLLCWRNFFALLQQLLEAEELFFALFHLFFRFFFTLGKSFHDNYTTLALSFGIWPSVKSNKKMNINWWETRKIGFSLFPFFSCIILFSSLSSLFFWVASKRTAEEGVNHSWNWIRENDESKVKSNRIP